MLSARSKAVEIRLGFHGCPSGWANTKPPVRVTSAHQHPLFELSPAVVAKFSHRHRIEVDDPPTTDGLGFGFDDPAVHSEERPRDREPSRLKVDR